MTLPPLSPTDNIEPYLSNAIADSKSCFVMLDGSDSPKTFKGDKFSGFYSVLGNSYEIYAYFVLDLDFICVYRRGD